VRYALVVALVAAENADHAARVAAGEAVCARGKMLDAMSLLADITKDCPRHMRHLLKPDSPKAE
jgi:hypothetical protein